VKLAMGVVGFWGSDARMVWMGGFMVGRTIVVEGVWCELW